MNKKVCCVTGHRPNNFPWNYKDKESASHQEYIEAMACYIDWYIQKHNVNYFICGGAIGVDTDFAEMIIEFRDNVYSEIQLEIVFQSFLQVAEYGHFLHLGWAYGDVFVKRIVVVRNTEVGISAYKCLV